jgi:L-alanine-DL-glutamate epimerase-like enolase superfamily enzyme
MIITDVETTILRHPVVEANGDGLQDVLLIRVMTDVGIVGIGEAHTVPTVLQAIIDRSGLAVDGTRAETASDREESTGHKRALVTDV